MLCCIYKIISIPKENFMGQNRKHLKISSIIVLILTGLTFLRVAGKFLFSDSGIAMLPDGSSVILKLIVRFILVAVTLVYLLPQTYVGVRGLHIAKAPAKTKGHIVWAWILLVIAILGLIEPVTMIVQNASLSGNALALFQGLLSIAIYVYYIKCATAVKKEN